VVKAFLPNLQTGCGLELRPFTLSTILLLEKIEHPLVDDAIKRDMTNHEIASLVFVLTHPAVESNALLSHGPDAFDAAVMEAADRIPLAELRSLGMKIRAHFGAALETAAAPGAEKKTN